MSRCNMCTSTTLHKCMIPHKQKKHDVCLAFGHTHLSVHSLPKTTWSAWSSHALDRACLWIAQRRANTPTQLHPSHITHHVLRRPPRSNSNPHNTTQKLACPSHSREAHSMLPTMTNHENHDRPHDQPHNNPHNTTLPRGSPARYHGCVLPWLIPDPSGIHTPTQPPPFQQRGKLNVPPMVLDCKSK
jgi:hypothetical protein